MGEGRWEDGGLADRGRNFVLERFAILPVEAGVNQDAGIALFVLGPHVGGFFVDRGDASYLTLLVNTRRRGGVMLAGLTGSGQLVERVARCPELEPGEVDALLDELAAARAAP